MKSTIRMYLVAVDECTPGDGQSLMDVAGHLAGKGGLRMVSQEINLEVSDSVPANMVNALEAVTEALHVEEE